MSEKAALDQAMQAFEGEAQPAQVDLFSADPANGEAASPFSKSIPAGKRGAGRPSGSLNKVTEAMRAYILSQHRHPLQVMAEAYSMTPVELGQALGLQPIQDYDDKGNKVGEPYWPHKTIIDLFKIQMNSADAVASYIMPRAPQQVAVAAQAGVNIVLGGVSVPARAGQAEKISAETPIEGEVLGVTIRAKSDE